MDESQGEQQADEVCTVPSYRKKDARLKRWEVKQVVADIAEEDKRY
ncbi:hypothetical protein [Paenibacillus sp. FSL P2-0136]